MKPDDIISYNQLVAEEKANLQKGMNYGIGKKYSVFLMSVRPGALYRDKMDPATGCIVYEAQDSAYGRTWLNLLRKGALE
jgi:hypothetical protein